MPQADRRKLIQDQRIYTGSISIRFVRPQFRAPLDRIRSTALHFTNQDKVVFSGKCRPPNEMGCGIFELGLRDGKFRKVLDSPGCLTASGFLSEWQIVSMSPDGKKVVAIEGGRSGQLQLIDLAQGTRKGLGGGFSRAKWSPDGKWIAAVEEKGKRQTILFETSTFRRRRSLGNTTGEWSPDSRFLLGWKDSNCSDNVGTLEAIDIDTGKRTLIASSMCNVIEVNESSATWMSSEVR
jgi:hypothetical protein